MDPPNEISPFLERLPPREIDLIELYYNKGKNQKDIAKIFGVTQGAVSSRLSRAKKRLHFLRKLPKITEGQIINRLSEFFNDLELEIIINMIRTTCQSKTAQLINEKYERKKISNKNYNLSLFSWAFRFLSLFRKSKRGRFFL